MLLNYLPILIILSAVSYLSVQGKKLTLPAAVTGWAVGLLVFAGAGYTGVAMLAVFFALGTGATSWGMSAKQKLGLAEEDKGRRTSGQVLANGGVAAILGVLIIAFPAKANLFRVMMASAFASATADTLSSEMGNIYGKNFYNVITFRKDTKGLDGVVSLEGTLIGIAGSIIIAAVYAAGDGLDINFLWIAVAGTVGNFSDSILGATLERGGFLHNNQVNFLNTAVAALITFFLFLIN